MGKISFLVIGDPHFKTSNIKECEKLIEKVCIAVDRCKPEFIVCLGDLLDKHETIHEAPFNVALKFMEELSKRCLTFLIVGNHDYCSNQQFLTDRHPYNALKKWENMIVVDQVKVYQVEELDFVFVPYVPPGRFLEALNTYDMWDMSDCIFAHQEFYGCKMGPITSVNGDKWSDEYPMVISGHIHNTQTVGSNVHYVGSCMQHAFGESDDKRIWLCELDSDAPQPFSYKKINLKLQKKRILYTSLNDLNNLDLTKYSNDKLKVCVKCSHEEYKSFVCSNKYKDLIGKNDVRVVHSKVERKMDEAVEKCLKKSDKFIGKGYTKIFKEMVEEENDKFLNETYNELTHDE